MSQTSYPMNQPIGIEGQLADTGPTDILTYNNPSVEIPFGRAMEKISGDANGVQLPDDGSANIVGMSVRDMSQAGDKYALNSAIAVNGVHADTAVSGNNFTVVSDPDVTLEISDVLVTLGASQATATVTETVEAKFTTDRGSIRASTDGSTAAAFAGTKFLTSAGADELAVLDVNLP
jgi:hypothetical protein